MRPPPTLALRVDSRRRVKPRASGLSAPGSCQEPERTGDPAEGDRITTAQITPRKEERRNRKESWNKQKTNIKWWICIYRHVCFFEWQIV